MAREISPKTNPRRKIPLEAASYKGWQNEDFRKRTPKGDGNVYVDYDTLALWSILESEPRKGTVQMTIVLFLHIQKPPIDSSQSGVFFAI